MVGSGDFDCSGNRGQHHNQYLQHAGTKAIREKDNRDMSEVERWHVAEMVRSQQ